MLVLRRGCIVRRRGRRYLFYFLVRKRMTAKQLEVLKLDRFSLSWFFEYEIVYKCFDGCFIIIFI